MRSASREKERRTLEELVERTMGSVVDKPAYNGPQVAPLYTRGKGGSTSSSASQPAGAAASSQQQQLVQQQQGGGQSEGAASSALTAPAEAKAKRPAAGQAGQAGQDGREGLKRPRSAYNFFSQDVRDSIAQEIAQRALSDPVWFAQQSSKIIATRKSKGPKAKKGKRGGAHNQGGLLEEAAASAAAADASGGSEMRPVSSRIRFILTTQAVAEQWRKLSETGGAELEKYVAKAANDRKRYEAEVHETAMRSVHVPLKQPGEPKYTRSAYIYFMKEKFNELRKETEQPGSSATQDIARMSARAGAVWRGMSEEERAPYVAMRVADHERYLRESAEWRGGAPRSKKRAKVIEPGPKKPQGAFQYFIAERRNEVVQANLTMTFGEVAKEMGRLWKELSAKDKEQYLELHKEDKKRYATEKAYWEKHKAATAGQLST